MDDDIQELRELVAQLRADNDRLRQEQASASTSSAPSVPPTAPSVPTVPSAPSAPVSERLVFIPRERKCPVFRGRTGLGLSEWREEVQACMRGRRLSRSDQAFFIFDHLEGEARDEIKYRSGAEREDPDRILAILQELYGCSDSYVALQEAFFSRRQEEGETLQEFSLALMGLMERVRQQAPTAMLNAESLLRDQFVEHVSNSALRRELKQMVRRQPDATLLDVRTEAIQWEREGLPGGVRGRSNSIPLVVGVQYGVHGGSQASEMAEMKEMLRRQQEQLNLLTESIDRLQNPQQYNRPPRTSPIICRRCNQPGHIARHCVARVSARPQAPSRPSSTPARHFSPASRSEN